jgi:tRNA threonylcarbamoyladenosine biosynthesis protein TsaB
MKLIALDTSSAACSVALSLEDAVFERHAVLPKEHTRLLMPMIGEVLAEAGTNLRELDAVVLGNGPGSFIGLRIAASVAQGLCYGGGLELLPLSSLEAVANEALQLSAAEGIAVAQDAHMNEVYLARFRRGDGALAVPEGEAELHPIGRIEALAGTASIRWHAAGAGWRRYPELLENNEELLAGVIDVQWPRARYLLEPGRRALLDGRAIAPDALVPAYVRTRVVADT